MGNLQTAQEQDRPGTVGLPQARLAGERDASRKYLNHQARLTLLLALGYGKGKNINY